jgi:hypothetical protein
MSKIQVRLLQPALNYGKGAVLDLTEPIARTLIEKGLAERVGSEDTVLAGDAGTKALKGSPRTKRG